MNNPTIEHWMSDGALDFKCGLLPYHSGLPAIAPADDRFPERYPRPADLETTLQRG